MTRRCRGDNLVTTVNTPRSPVTAASMVGGYFFRNWPLTHIFSFEILKHNIIINQPRERTAVRATEVGRRRRSTIPFCPPPRHRRAHLTTLLTHRHRLPAVYNIRVHNVRRTPGGRPLYQALSRGTTPTATTTYRLPGFKPTPPPSTWRNLGNSLRLRRSRLASMLHINVYIIILKNI